MYGLRSINNMYSEHAGKRSDFVIVGHPEYNYGKVGSANGFGPGWCTDTNPMEPKTSPAIARLRRNGSAKLIKHLATVHDTPPPKPQERALAKKQRASSTSALRPGGEGSVDAGDLTKNFDAFIAALLSPETMPVCRPSERVIIGASNYMRAGGLCKRYSLLNEELAELAERLKRNRAATERDLLMTKSWKYYALQLDQARRQEGNFRQACRRDPRHSSQALPALA
mmetsp:Transcript_40358/g.75440  ORF Transcript_40358/g.75440 Transcript_40358/m.75440 type:complete len:226 (-) Transcript_40358:75-752(-)